MKANRILNVVVVAMVGVLLAFPLTRAFAAEDDAAYRAAGTAAATAALQPVDLSAGAVQGETRPIADGFYYVKSAASSNIVLEDPKASTAKNVQLRVYGKTGDNKQRLYVRNEGGGLVSFQVVASGLFLADASGAAVQLPWSSAADRLWRPVWSNGYAFVNASTGHVLSLAGGKSSPGTKAVTLPETGAGSQRWLLAKTAALAGGYYRFKSAVGTSLEVANGSYAYGANIRAYKRRGGGAQVFRIVKKSGGYYQVVNAQTFLAVAVKGASKAKKANVVQAKRSSSGSQLWKPQLDRSGYLVFKNRRSGKVLEIAGSSKKSGANVRQNTRNGKAKGQGWRLKAVAKYSLSGNAKLDKRVANVLRTHGSLESAFNWTVNHSYRNGARYWSGPRVLSNATTVKLANDFFAHGSGNCYRFASTFSWLARGLGYKTKVISGWVQSTSGGRAPHGWVEVKSGGTRVCDPDLAQAIPGHNWFMCTYATSPTEYHNW